MRSEIAAATRSKLEFLRAVEVDIAGGATTAQMTSVAARERMNLAYSMLSTGDGLLTAASKGSDVGAVRSSISRFYYAMFQAARAVVYVDYGGDDHNAHQELPKRLPASFPSNAYWSNELKKARLKRNDADYDPYPTPYLTWEPEAMRLQQVARDFVQAADAFLLAKGV